MRLLATALLTLAIAQTPGPATGAISGRVTDGSTGRPVDGALVVLSTHPRGNPTAVVLRVATDAGGRFVFTRLPAAQAYYLHAAQFGYFEGGYGRDVPATAEGRAIPLAEGEWVNDLAIRLWRPASISGRVIDEAGEPVVGAIVRVLPQILVAGVTRTAAGPTTRTDDRGVYRIGNLAPGKVVVSLPSVQSAVPSDTPPATLANMPQAVFVASTERTGRPPELPQMMPVAAGTDLFVGPYVTPPLPRDGRARVYPPTFHPSARTIPEAGVVELQYGEDRGGVDLQLRAEIAVPVSGRLVGPPEAIGGLTVRLLPRGSEGLGIGSEAATALVGPSGAFHMPLVAAGEYVLVTARSTMQYHYAPGGSNLQTDLPDPPGSGGSYGAGTVIGATPGVGYSYRSSAGTEGYSGRLPITVSAPGLKDLVVEMRAGVSIRGRVVMESGVVAAPGAASGAGPIPPSQLTLQTMYAEPADGNPELGMLSGRLDRTSQQFEVSGLQAGLYRLRLWGVPHIKSIVWQGQDLTYEPFDAALGHDFDGVVITGTDQPATIAGSVRDETGNSVANAAVLVFPTDRRRWTRFGFSPPYLRSLTTSSAGSYSVSLPGGEYYVVAVDASRAGGLYDPEFLATAAQRAATVRVAWGETKSQVATLRVIR